MGPLVARKWLIALVSSSFGLAFCSWFYLRSRGYLRWNAGTSSTLLERAWLWMQALLATPKPARTDEVTPSHVAERDDAPQLPWHVQEATSSASIQVNTALEMLSERRITGSPRTVVLSGRNVRFCSSMRSF